MDDKYLSEIFRNNSSREWDEESGSWSAMGKSSFLKVVKPLYEQVKEMGEITLDRDRIHAHRIRLVDEIAQLKEELKREREAIDIISIIHSNDDVGLDRASAMLIVAEETQKQRKIKL